MRPRKMFPIYLLLLASRAFAAEALDVTYEDLPKWIREKNQAVTGAEDLKRGAEAKTGYLARSYLPVVGAQIGGEHFTTGPFSPQTEPYGGVEARVNLFRGGRDRLEENARESQAQAAQASAQKTYLTELTEARRVYWTLIYTREWVSTLKEALKQNEQNLAAANRRIARGLATETDRLEFEIYRSQLKEEIESETHGEILLRIRLANQIGVGAQTSLRTPVRIEHLHDEKLIEGQFEGASHPEVALLRASSEAASAQGTSYSRWWMPSLDVYGGYFLYTLRDRDFLARADRDDLYAGVRLSFDLFDGLQSKASANALALQAQGYQEQAAQRARAAGGQILATQEELKHDHELIHNAEERIGLGKRYFTRTLDEYNRGVKNSIDVLGAAQKALGFERQYAERRRDYQLTKSNLLALIGQ